MKIGIRLHDIKRMDSLSLVKAAKDYGFDSVQLVLKKAVKEIDFTKCAPTLENMKFISEAYKNINVAMLGAYFNPVHSNKQKVENDVKYFKEMLQYAKMFNCNLVGTETGSFLDEPWQYHPKNQTEEGYQEAKSVLAPLVEYAKTQGCNIAFEGAWGHVMYKPSVLKRLYDEIASDNLKIIVDVYNYLYIKNHENAFEIFKECLDLFGDTIEVFHIKDYVVEEGQLKQTTIGKGIMPLDKMLPLMKECCPNATLVFEGSKEEDLIFSYNFVKRVLGEK